MILWGRIKHDVFRYVGLLVTTILLFWLNTWLPMLLGEAILGPILTSAAIATGIGLISHLTRRILFPDLDLMEYAVLAKGNPVASAIVFASVCFVVASLFFVNVFLVG